MVSVSSFKSSSIQHDVHFVNYGPVYFKIDDKAGYASGQGCLVIDRLQVAGTIMTNAIAVILQTLFNLKGTVCHLSTKTTKRTENS